MKKSHVFLSLIIFLFSCSSAGMRKPEEDKTIELQKIIAEIESALSAVNGEIEKKTALELTGATLVLNTAIKKSIDGSMKYLVVSGRISGEKKDSDKISVKLKPVKRQKQSPSFESEVNRRLAGLIISAAEGVSKAGEGKFPMYVESLTIEMGLTVKTAASADTDIGFELIPVSAGIDAAYSTSGSDVLKIEFSRKK